MLIHLGWLNIGFSLWSILSQSFSLFFQFNICKLVYIIGSFQIHSQLKSQQTSACIHPFFLPHTSQGLPMYHFLTGSDAAPFVTASKTRNTMILVWRNQRWNTLPKFNMHIPSYVFIPNMMAGSKSIPGLEEILLFEGIYAKFRECIVYFSCHAFHLHIIFCSLTRDNWVYP